MSLESSCILLWWMCSIDYDYVSLVSSLCATWYGYVPLDSSYVLLWIDTLSDDIVLIVMEIIQLDNVDGARDLIMI
jgi:hypothetical protein